MPDRLAFYQGPISRANWRAIAGEPSPSLASAISKLVAWHGRQTIVSVNKVLESLCALFPDCGVCDQELTRLIQRSARSSGFVAVYDPHWPQRRAAGDISPPRHS